MSLLDSEGPACFLFPTSLPPLLTLTHTCSVFLLNHLVVSSALSLTQGSKKVIVYPSSELSIWNSNTSGQMVETSIFFFIVVTLQLSPFSPFLPISTQPPPHPSDHHHHPVVHVCESCIDVPWLIHSLSFFLCPLPSPLREQLSDCSLYPYLYFYFGYEFILFIRYHI